MIQKMNESKEKNHQNRFPISPANQKWRDEVQISRIREEKGNITTDTPIIERIIRKFYRQLYASKSEYLKELNRF